MGGQLIEFECVECGMESLLDSRLYQRHGPMCRDCIESLKQYLIFFMRSKKL